MSNLSVHNLINSCIRIEQKRISRQRTIPVNINFDLNQEILSKIASLRDNQQKILFSGDNLVNLRYCFLLNSSENLGLGITFQTYYDQDPEKIAIIKSVIYLSGKVEQYIRNDAISHGRGVYTIASKEIIDAHYWLIRQIFNQIPLTYKKGKSIILWLLLGLITIIVACFVFLLLPTAFWFKVLFLIFFVGITFKILQQFLRRYLPSWVLHQLLFGIFSASVNRKKIGFNLLTTLDI